MKYKVTSSTCCTHAGGPLPQFISSRMNTSSRIHKKSENTTHLSEPGDAIFANTNPMDSDSEIKRSAIIEGRWQWRSDVLSRDVNEAFIHTITGIAWRKGRPT